MNESMQLPAPFVTGETWFEQMASYVTSRAIDAEYIKAFRVNDQTPQYFGRDLRLGVAGQPNVSGVRGMGNGVLLLAGAAVVLFLVLRK